MLDDRLFQTYVVVADSHDREAPLPAHQLVVNGIGDADVASAALIAAESLLELTSARVVNLPAAVLASQAMRECQALRQASRYKSSFYGDIFSFPARRRERAGGTRVRRASTWANILCR
jgi:hypothetical protein